jgi:hypothetical protein
MQLRHTGLLLIVALSACSTLSERTVPRDVAQKRNEVEVFLKRNGFTCAGHPQDEPVMAIRSFDEFLSTETVLKNRRCDFKPVAYSYRREESGGIAFVFAQDRKPYLAHMAGVSSDGNVWVNESYCDLNGKGFVRLPPNSSPEPTRER